MKFISIIFLFCISNLVFSITNSEINYYKNLEKKYITENKDSSLDMLKLSKKQNSYKEYAKNIAVEGQKNLNSYNGNEKKGNGIIVFLSFSMPPKMIKSYINEAIIYNASIVIEGVLNDSFKFTLDKIKKFLVKNDKEYKQTGIAIDPISFKLYGVKSVPAIVLTEDVAPCHEQDFSKCKRTNFDKITGAVSITGALEEFSKKGQLETTANKILRNVFND